MFSTGCLKAHENSTISLYITETLTHNQWAELLSTCQTLNIKINPMCAAGVTLPEALELTAPEAPPIARQPTCHGLSAASIDPADKPWGVGSPGDYVIYSTDRDLTEASIKSHHCINISEVSPGQLLQKTDANFDKTTLKFSFTEADGALLQALANDETIVLTGMFQPDLISHLQQFILDRRRENPPKGQLILLTEQEDLKLVLPAFEHQVKNTGRRFTQSEAIKRSTGDPWVGMHQLPPKSNHAQMPWDKLLDARMEAVDEVLRQSPYVFLAGKTGVGKTTFVQKHWAKTHPAMHYGEASIKAWAADPADGIKTLFIDEANISSRQWSEFEGLFKTPRTILIDNKLVPLSPEHKVIFAGNPCSYGGERTLPSLFERHGNSVLFEPLSPEFLYHHGLKALLVKINANYPEVLAKPFLKVAGFLSHLNPEKVLMSPRELQHMALSSLAYCQKNLTASPSAVVNYFAYSLAKNLVPKESKLAFEALWDTVPQLQQSHPVHLRDIALNTSNHPAFNALNNALDVRELRQSTPGTHLGGLSGVVLEGEAGLGKSELVLDTLRARQLKENKDFYLLSAGTPCAEKRKVLAHAFHAGAIVVMDEINSAAMMERELNECLTGTCDGKSAQHPGFLIIGTQNPATYAHRVSTSEALQRRFNQVSIPPYQHDELVEILQGKALPEDTSTDMVTEYLAHKETLSLCCRDLIKRAAQCSSANKRKTQSSVLSTSSLFMQPMSSNQEDEIDQDSQAEDDEISWDKKARVH